MRIGVLGGTFDPIHLGHTHIALEVARLFALDRVDFMVSRVPPHKKQGGVTDSYHRYAMVALALQDEDQLYPSGWELRRKGPSYTIHTLSALQRAYPDDSFCFIGGSDSLSEIHLWKDCGKLMKGFCLVFVQRPGAEVTLSDLEAFSKPGIEVETELTGSTPRLAGGTIYLVSVNPPAVSSSAIRKQIRTSPEKMAECLSPPVYRYIQKHRLYYGNKCTSEEDV